MVVSGRWQAAARSTLSGSLSRIAMHDRAKTGESIATGMHVQFSQAVAFVPARPPRR